MEAKKETKLRYLMDTYPMTAEQVSTFSGVSKRMIEKYANGERELKKASFETVMKIAYCLCVQPLKLFWEDEIDLE